MSSKTLDINTFFTPTTCFTIACLAFSLVAISTAWSNATHARHEKSRATVHPASGHANDERKNESSTDLAVENERQSQVASIVAFCARTVQQLHSKEHAFRDEIATALIGELSLLASSLCRLQKALDGKDDFLRSHKLSTCFDSTMCSLLATFSLFQADPFTGDCSTARLGKALHQIRDQRPLLDILLASLCSGKEMETFSSNLSIANVTGQHLETSDRHETVSIVVPEDIAGAKEWNEPPPEYSPPASNINTVFSEKSKFDLQAPAMDLAATSKASDALYEAVTRNDLGELTDLLVSGVDHSVHFGDLKRTPLHQAAHLNRVDCLAVLLKHGAAIDTEDAKGDTALHLAAWAGSVEALAALLAHGADVDWISGRNGYSPLWCVVSAFQIDAARLLLKNGARVSLRSVSGAGLTALHQAAVTNQGAMCELLLERGAQPDSVDDDKSTPLHYAAASGSIASTKVLLRGGANVEARQVDGLTPVHWAAHKGHTDVLNSLLGHGARLECKTESGATPLHLAANRGHEIVARVLVERGANRKSSASWDGIEGTPADMAKARAYSKLAKTLAI